MDLTLTAHVSYYRSSYHCTYVHAIAQQSIGDRPPPMITHVVATTVVAATVVGLAQGPRAVDRPAFACV